MKNIQNILIFFIVWTFAMVATQTRIGAQDAHTGKKPSLAIFVVGMDNKAGDTINKGKYRDTYLLMNRGGCYSNEAGGCRVSARFIAGIGLPIYDLGFRVVLPSRAESTTQQNK
jgi:hypothetical protein